MKAAPFEYHAPTTVQDAISVLRSYGEDAKPLAGGQSMVPLLALRLARFEHLVDLNRVEELRRVERNSDELIVGAMARQAVVERSTDVADAVPLLTAAIPHIGHVQIRNRGTVGGSIAHADPASELPAVALALDAQMDLDGVGGPRTVNADSFFQSTWTTAIGDGELLVRTRFPVWGGRQGVAVEEYARREGDFAIAGVAAAIGLGADGNVTRAGIGLFGMAATPVRARQLEAALVGHAPPEASDLEELGRLAVADADPNDDLHASADYRIRVGAHLVARALTRAFKEAEHG